MHDTRPLNAPRFVVLVTITNKVEYSTCGWVGVARLCAPCPHFLFPIPLATRRVTAICSPVAKSCNGRLLRILEGSPRAGSRFFLRPLPRPRSLCLPWPQLVSLLLLLLTTTVTPLPLLSFLLLLKQEQQQPLLLLLRLLLLVLLFFIK